MQAIGRHRVHQSTEWTRMLSDAQSAVDGPVPRRARERGLRFAVGGGFAADTGDVIVDVIWAMANHRAEGDHAWLERGPEVSLRSRRLPVISAGEMVRDKLHVLQRDRCDWDAERSNETC